MKTVTDSIREILGRSPYLSEALSEGIINYSALARKLKPELDQEHMKDFTDGAIIMALKRLQKDSQSTASRKKLSSMLRNITMRSNLTEYAVKNSPRLASIYQELLEEKKV